MKLIESIKYNKWSERKKNLIIKISSIMLITIILEQ